MVSNIEASNARFYIKSATKKMKGKKSLVYFLPELYV